MKSISVSDYLHKWIMDHKDSVHKSADEVLMGLVHENNELNDEVEQLSAHVEHYKKIVNEWSAQQRKEIRGKED